ncbi:TPA: hypothetical protein I8023_000850 [Legionella pneumophila]|nr:hypothetical protein [Legionella pneumophila]
MFNLKMLGKKILGNSKAEMDFFLECKNGTLTKSKLHDYLFHYRININTQFAGRELATQGYDGYSPLMYYLGSSSCNYDIAECLIEHGANANHQSRYGHTPTHCLAYGNSTEKINILKLLKKHGSNFDLQNSSNELCIAPYITSGSAEEVEYILCNSIVSKRLLEECPFPWGRGVFHEIIIQLSNEYLWKLEENIKKIELLIKYEFDINKKTTSSPYVTPLKMLRQNFDRLTKNESIQSFQYIERLFISQGAKEN